VDRRVKQGYFVNQGSVASQFAKETTNPKLAAVLMRKRLILNLKLMSRARLLKRRMLSRHQPAATGHQIPNLESGCRNGAAQY